MTSLSPSPQDRVVLADLPAKDLQVPQAPLQEVFSSIQGEGLYVGRRQIFVRFAHCHLKCTYCDTPMTSSDGRLHVFPVFPSSENTPSEAVPYDNPVSADQLLTVLEGFWQQVTHHSVSFTGGEPLLYHRFLQALLPQVQPHCPVYLETSGTQPDFLAAVLPWVDIIAMDIKLPSATGEAAQFESHRRFIEVASQNNRVQLFTKVVFNQRIGFEELSAIAGVVQDPNIPIILQPVTTPDGQMIMDMANVLQSVETLSRSFADVRVIPQTHKMLNVQ